MSGDSDGEFYGDTDPGNLPVGQAGPSAGSELPGYPVDGHPEWRAGLFGSGRGLLGLAQAADPAGPPAGDDRAPFNGKGDPRLMRASDPVLDWEQNSWRWNDPEAIAYDLDRKQRELAEAQNLATASQLVGKGQGALAGARAATGIGVGASLPAGAAATGVGLYMKHVETPRLQQEIVILQNRLSQLRARSAT